MPTDENADHDLAAVVADRDRLAAVVARILLAAADISPVAADEVREAIDLPAMLAERDQLRADLAEARAACAQSMAAIMKFGHERDRLRAVVNAAKRYRRARDDESTDARGDDDLVMEEDTRAALYEALDHLDESEVIGAESNERTDEDRVAPGAKAIVGEVMGGPNPQEGEET